MATVKIWARRAALGVAVLLALGAGSGAAQGRETGEERGGGDDGLGALDGRERVGFILGRDGQPREITYVEHDGWAVYGGDMLLGRADELAATPAEALAQAEADATDRAEPESAAPTPDAVGAGQSTRWPNGTVYYAFHSGLTGVRLTAAQNAIAHLNSFNTLTGVFFVPRTTQAAYVLIQSTTGVANAEVGYKGRAQNLFLSSGIWQVAVHELGHTIGLWHEHQRCERDAYVTASNSGVMTKDCAAPAVEPYNPLSIMHYSATELSGLGGASLKPGVFAPAKSAHPGLVPSDIRSIATLYGLNSTFSQVSLMHGKCLDAPSNVNGTRAHMWDCGGLTNPNQRWTYAAGSGELRVHGTKCLDGWTAKRLDPVVVHDCHGGGNQKWDIGSHGEIVLRGIKDEAGRPLCADIANLDRANGARLLLQYCHWGDNQLWRRDANGVGGGSVQYVSEIVPASVDSAPRPHKCLDAPGSTTGLQLQIWDCGGGAHPNQRFVHNANKELRVFGKCVDADAGLAGNPVKVWDCHGGANQKWDLTPSGNLQGVNGLCIGVPSNSNANGTRLVLGACDASLGKRWSPREPRP
jgi:Astacin (Peptidase family M12A)/Ricin-type beta-trefoil lectin domain